jgi:PPOX class probable F420-dependent enzyme
VTRTEATILELPPRVRQRLAAEEVAWLTTITARDAPAPAPVWFVLDEGFLTVFSSPTTKKARNIRRRPLVTLHLNSDPKGSGIVVVTGRATVEDGVAPSSSRGYVEKYRPAILRRGLTVEEFDRVSSTRIRIRPLRVWLGGRRLADEVQREEGARDGADDSAT